MPNSLYICYFGVREPLVQTQVIPYLVEIGKSDVRMSLLTFEPSAIDQADADKLRSELHAKGIEWTWLRYHKWPSAIATAYDVFCGMLHVWRMIDRERIDVLHGRVHLPTLMGALARKLSRRKPKLLFDIRGFMPEEYTDAGIWPKGGLLYRSAKRAERWLMRESDGFVVLTEKAREILFPNATPHCGGGWLTPSVRDIPSAKRRYKIQDPKSTSRPVEVIPCCVDLELRFSANLELARASARAELGVERRRVFVHSGALGGLYLTQEIVELLSVAKIRDHSTFALILTQSDPTAILKLLGERGFSEADYLIKKVAPSQIPRYLAAADFAISFVKSSFSTLSRSPTKIPEYLACGLPILANAGVGDIDELISTNKIGVLIESLSCDGLNRALDELTFLSNRDDLRINCQEVAKKHFDLQGVGGNRYLRIYRKLSGND